MWEMEVISEVLFTVSANDIFIQKLSHPPLHCLKAREAGTLPPGNEYSTGASLRLEWKSPTQNNDLLNYAFHSDWSFTV